MGWRRILRFEYVGVSLDLLIIALASFSTLATVIWRSVDNESNEGFDALSYLDFLIILRLARWTRRAFYFNDNRGSMLVIYLRTLSDLNISRQVDINVWCNLFSLPITQGL